MTNHAQAPLLQQTHIDVISGYARGLTVREIANELGITEKAVRSRTLTVSRSLGIKGARQAALVEYAYQHGYLAVPRHRRRNVKPLTPRLAEVLDCAARGLGFRATADELGIAGRTARAHRDRLHKTLKVHTTARAVAVAWETGLRGAAGERKPW